MELRPSPRAQIVERRTYLRPLDDAGTTFETYEMSIDRIVGHQQWLWQRAVNRKLNVKEKRELQELRTLLLERKITLSGRTRWLGGTPISKTREASQFNCAFCEIRDVYSVVDSLWLLLNGCGVGFRPVVGILNGFATEIKDIQVVRSKMTMEIWENGIRGRETNKETFDRETGTWTISIGDSAEAWAKSIGKLLAGKYPAKKLIIDFAQIRPAGLRLKGYGWISSGDESIAIAFLAIAKLLSKRAGTLLTRIDILDLLTWLGTILSSRRSSEICLMSVEEPEWMEFALAKKDYFLPEVNQPQRSQSNNSLLFYHKPSRNELENIFQLMQDAGGSEPGFINAAEALRRASWFKGVNPCAEILLGDKSFCNLVETVLMRFNGDEEALHRAHYIVTRANYRQTCVNLDDGILSRGWHELNEFLRLCGAGVTSAVAWEGVDSPEMWQSLRKAAQDAANSMADELHLPRAKAVTTVKPSGTASKTLSLEGMECPEGVHKPLGRFIFNNVILSKYDPLVNTLTDAGYHIFDHPMNTWDCLVRIPVEFNNISFDTVTKTIRGEEVEVEVNLESALSQLNRYKMLQENYVDHNTSITVSYDPSEVPGIIDWFMENWGCYVGVSFLYRTDPSKTAADLGYPYLPQEVVDEKTFREYASTLKPIDLTGLSGEDEVDTGGECATGACPIR